MIKRNLKKFPRRSLEPFKAPHALFLGASELPRSVFLVPEGSRGRFRAILKMLNKNVCFYCFFGHGATSGPCMEAME